MKVTWTRQASATAVVFLFAPNRANLREHDSNPLKTRLVLAENPLESRLESVENPMETRLEPGLGKR
jgi:hypothetical protein